MKDKIRNNISKTSALVGLALITLLFGFMCGLFGELAFPLYTAALAALFLYDKNSKRVLSVSLPVVVIAMNVLLGSYVPSVAVFAIVAAFILSFMYNKGLSKGECAGYMTAVCSLMIIIGAFAFAMLSVKQFSFTAAIGYFEEMYNKLLEETIKALENMLSSSQQTNVSNGFSEEMLKNIFSSMVMTIPSFVVCFSFL